MVIDTKISHDTNRTAMVVKLSVAKAGSLGFLGRSEETAKVASELLQKNHEIFHMYFNEMGFHNHIAHYLLCLYDVGAPSDILKSAYERETSYQLPMPPVSERAIIDLSDESKWGDYLGVKEHYGDFLTFFTREIEEIGWKETIKQRLFSRTPLAESMFVRFYSGLWHPFIHLGYGIEFELPAIIAEALAQAATHDDSIGAFFLPIEMALKESKSSEKLQKSLSAIIEELHNNTKVANAVQSGTPVSKRFQDLLENAGSELTSIISQFTVPPDPASITAKTAESINVSAKLCGGATRSDRKISFDFFLMHCLTSSLFLGVLIDQDWIELETKARIIEWKARGDAGIYAVSKVPKLRLDEIRNYTPREKARGSQWANTLDRTIALKDQSGGHVVKAIRALAYAERRCHSFSNEEGFEIQGDMWSKLAAMVIDSVEVGPEGECEPVAKSWVFGAGFDESWDGFPERK